MLTQEEKQLRLQEIRTVAQAGPFEPSWESLARYRAPEWFREAKLGIFIHWGVYSVPAFGSEWYPRNMYIQGSREYEHHIATYGPHKEFGYKDFVPMFKAEQFDPEKWAELFARAGAKYVVPVAEHHDGFQMYDSDISDWNAAKKGPCRNVLGELGQAVRDRGMTLGASTHRIEHWFFLGHGREFESDIVGDYQPTDLYWPAMPEPRSHHDVQPESIPNQEYIEDWLLRCCELVDRYQPQMVYFDWWIHLDVMKPWLQLFAAYYYNRAAQWGREVVIAYKHDAFAFGTAVLDIERGQFSSPQPFLWQTDTAIAKNSWCYTDGNQFKNPRDIICDLLDIISKNGRMLLNVGPKSDGTISDEDTAVLTAIGDRMDKTREGVDGTFPWKKFGEGPTQVTEGQFTDGVDRGFTKEDFRFTTLGDAIYAYCLRFPEDGKIAVKALGWHDVSSKPEFGSIIESVEAMGYPGAVKSFERTGDGLLIETEGISTDMPVGFKIRIH